MRLSPLSRSVVLGVCVAALVGGLLAVPAAAAPEQTSSKDEVVPMNAIAAIGLVGINTRTGRSIELEPVKAVSKLVDSVTGNVLGKGTLRMNVASTGPADGLRSCIKNGTSKRLTAYRPANRYISDDKGTVHFQYHPYRLSKARRVGSGLSTQWEVCSVGGGDLDGDRLRRVGTGIALNDAVGFHKIGQAWQTGETPESYKLDLAFQVEKGPVSIGATISQQPSDKLLGSIRGPFPTVVDAFDRNAVNAWWQDTCIGRWYGCLPNSGSEDYQGAIAHGLWEFPKGQEPETVAFWYSAYVSR